MKLYHTGFEEIRKPDLTAGRANADFGQGFYLSPDEAFSLSWAKSRKGLDAIVNVYELDPEDLDVKTFERDMEWYRYICSNRYGHPDKERGRDILMGPVSIDTLYDTWGILTSGYLPEERCLEILSLGPCYQQVVLKTEKALSHLKFLSSSILPERMIEENRSRMKEEEKAFQTLLMEKLGKDLQIFE